VSVKANWHLAKLEMDDQDPMDIRQFATPIDVGGQEARLHRELAASLRIEARKYEAGVSCELKSEHNWPDEWSCRTCPERTEDHDDPLAIICSMSMRQIDILEEIALLRVNPDEALLRALADAHGDWAIWEAEDLWAAHGEWALAEVGSD
jgi:hypothetical protein